MLASLGGVLGTYMATWGDVWIKSLLQYPTPYWMQFPFDRTALVFSVLAVVVTGVGISVLPALRGSRLELAARMNQGDLGGVARGGKLRRLLIVSQFGASAVLLVSALLVTKSYVAIDDTENGYATDGVVTMRVTLDGDAYEDPPPAPWLPRPRGQPASKHWHRRGCGRRVGASGLGEARRSCPDCGLRGRR